MRNVNLLLFKANVLNFLFISIFFSLTSMSAQTNLIDPAGDGGFETGATFAANNWTAVNTATANGSQWFITSTILTNGSYSFAPTTSRAAYISNNGGTNWRYNTSAAAASSHIYKDVTFPSGETKINLSFRYNVGPAEATWDEMYVYLCPQTLTPVANSPSSSTTTVTWTGTGTATLLGTFRNLVAGAGASSGTIAIPAAIAGNTVSNSAMRLVFTWKNDGGGGTEPPSALDDVSLTSVAPVPICNSLGTYTIDNTLANTVPGGGFNFSSFTNAINYLNSDGICGPLTLNVTAGQTFTENPPALTATGTVANPIIFQKSGGGANPVLIDIQGTSTSTDFGFCISGGDYITFDGIDVNSSTASTSNLNLEFGYLLRNSSATNGAQFITIKNCSITLNKNFVGSSSSGCIYSSVSTSQGGFTPTNATGANSNNKFYNLTLTNAQNGLYLVGNSGFPDLNNEIGVAGAGCQAARNTISNMGGVTTFTSAYGIRCDGQSGVKIFNNDISNIRSNQSTTAGILLITFAGTNDINNNKVSDVSNSGSTSATGRAVGIEIQNSSGTHTARVYNNVIFDIKSPFTGSATASRYAIGIFANNTSTATTSEIDNNSVYLSVASGTPTYSSTCFEIANSGTAVHKVRGNIFVNAFPAQGATAKHFCWVSTAAAAIGGAGTVSNHNDLFILNDQGTSGHVGRGSTTNYNTLANWQAITALPDANSISTNPLFTSVTDLHSSASALNAFSGYTPQAWITTDIECADRSTSSPSDLGAYVINTCSVADGGTITPATQNKCIGQTTTMTSTGATTGSGITYQWKVSMTSGSGYANVSGGSGSTSTSYTTDALTAGTYYYVLETTCSAGPTTDLSNELTVVVNALPTVTVSPTSGSLCQPGASPITLTGGGASTYAWSPATGLSATTGAIVDANPASTQAYVVTGTDLNGCTNTAMATVTVAGAVSTSVSATPSPICSGENSQLLASGLQSFTTPAAASYGFAGSTGTYSAITGTTLPNGAGDEVGNGNLPIGFTFNYNSTNQTVFAAHSNGFLILGNTTPTISGNFNFTNALATGSLFIAPLWDDNNTTDGSIIYSTTGTAPTRVLTVQWTGIHIGGNGSATNPTINMQVKLYEGSNRIEFIYGSTSAALSSTTASIGISGASGNYLSVTPLSPANTSTVSSVSENTTISSATNFPSGTVYTFTPTGAPVFSYSWSPATFLSATNISNPLATAVTSSQTYTVTVTGNGGCSNTANVTVNVSSGASITAEPVSDSKCEGQTATFTVAADGPSLTYQWRKDGVDIPIGGNASAGTPTLSLTNVMAGDADTYDVVVASSCGSPVMSNGASTLTVNGLPTITVTPTSGSICNPGGSPVVLTAGGGVSYTWDNTGSLTPTSGSPVSAAPTTTTTYTLTGTDGNGCINTAMATITVGDIVSVTASATPSTICSGENSQLLASGIQSFTTPSPSAYGFAGATGAYSVITGTTLSIGSTDDNGVGNLPIGFTFNYNGTNHTVFGMRTNGLIELSQTSVALSGFNANALVSNANCIAPIWDDNNMVGGTMIYSTTGSVGSRILTAQWTAMHVGGTGSGSNPTINVQVKLYETSNKIEFIYGSTSAALSSTTASIGISGALGNFLSVTPLSPVNTSTTSSVSENSSISSATNFPSGTVYTFTPTGAPIFSYNWSPATFLSSTNISNPLATAVTASTTYTVTVTGNAGCNSTANVIVEVSAGPSITAQPVSETKCVGQTATFTVAADGPSLTYQWRKGGVDIPIGGNASAGTPTLSLTNVMAGDAAVYDVVVSSSCGSPVTSNGASTLVVNTLPTVTVSPSTATICNPGGSPVTLTASGGVSYAWNNTESLTPTSGSPVSAAPTTTTTYTVTGTDSNGCTNTSTSIITVSSAITASATATPSAVCSGSNSQLNVTTIPSPGGGAIKITEVCLNRGGTGGGVYPAFATGQDLVELTNISNIPIDISGWALSDHATNTVAATHTGFVFPASTIIPPNSVAVVCLGTGTNDIANRYYNTGGASDFWISSGLVGIVLKNGATVVDAVGCGSGYVFNAGTGVTAGDWSGFAPSGSGLAGTTRIVANDNNIGADWSPSSTTTQTIGVYNAGFTSPISIASYLWTPSTFIVGQEALQNPIATAVTGTTTYSVTVTTTDGCTAMASATVTVAPLSSSATANNPTICAGSSAMLTATPVGGGAPYTYLWNDPANSTTVMINVSPATTTTYTVTITDNCPNTTTAEITIMVNPKPTTSASNDGPKCEGSVLNLSGTHSGGNTFTWTGPASYSASTQNAVRSALTLAHSGTYTFTTTSEAGCTSDPATTLVSVISTPSDITVNPLNPVLCTTNPAALLTANGGTVKASRTFSSGAINIAIPDDNPTGINHSLTVSGVPIGSTIDSVIAVLNIAHTFVSDLYLTLQGPNTNIEELIDQRGGGSDNYTNTRITSDVSKPSITTGFAPFTGTFSADGVLSNLFSEINGNWTLDVSDVSFGASGTLNNWSLIVYYTTPTNVYWSPTSGLFTDAAATMAYTGTSTSMVYAKPVSTETFTATASTEAQFTLDGNIIESGWGAALATSAGGPTPGFAAGHEINALYVQGGDKNINFGIAGNVQDGNRILIFIDSKSGGYNDGSFGRSGAPQGIDDFNSGTTFDAGFEADYCLVIGTNGLHDNFFFDLYTLSPGGGPATYLGDVSDPKIGADPLNASNTRGFEIAILKTLLGYTGGTVKVFAMYTSDGGFLSNQFLTRAGNAEGNYESGAVVFGSAMPDPVTVPLTNLQNYCISTGTVTVGIEGTIVKNTANSGLNTLRSVYGCITEGGTITYDQPTTTTTVLTADMPINKNVTIQGLSDVDRPEITMPTGGISTTSGKTLTLQNVDLKSSGSATFTGTGDVIILMDAITVIKQ